MQALSRIFSVKFNLTKDTAVAALSGVAVILLSSSMYLYDIDSTIGSYLNFFILDLLIRTVIGFALPLYYILVFRKRPLSFFGIRKDKSVISLIAGIVLMGLLLLQFIFESGERGSEILFKASVIFPVLYIMVSGIFEMVFIYGFLRKIFEESFGIIPGVLLTAVFYSFHHAGFQPEFLKLFFVGIMYAAVFRITDNILIIFPFFWGIGAVWDVLVNFGTEKLEGSGSVYRAAVVFLMMCIISVSVYERRKMTAYEK